MIRTATAILLACASVTIAPLAYAAPTGTTEPTVQAFPTAWCKTPAPLADSDLSDGFIRPPGRLYGARGVTVTTIYVDFPNAPAADSAATFQETYVEPGFEFAEELSHQGVPVTSTPYTQWVRMPKPSTDYSWDAFSPHRDYLRDAIAAADDSVDFSHTDIVDVIAVQSATTLMWSASFAPAPGDGITADGHLITNGLTMGATPAEWRSRSVSWGILKAFGLAQLAGGAPQFWAYPFSLNSYISATAPELFGWEQWISGWLPDAQALCLAAGTSTFPLSDLIGNSGTRVAVVPLAADRAVVLESRTRAGVDADGHDGVLVYVVDPTVKGPDGPIRIATDNGVPITGLAPGSTLTVEGVQISVLERGSSAYTVSVTAASPPTAIPGKVSGLTARVTGRIARVTWSEPNVTGWLPVIRYQYRIGSGAWTDTTRTQFRIARLPARGKTVAVRAVNAQGIGPATSLRVSR